MPPSTSQSASNPVATAVETNTTSYIALLDCNGNFGDTFWESERKDEHHSNNGNEESHTMRSNEATKAISHAGVIRLRTMD
ncbi:hypothetical protein MMC26_001050 [Xylographa opegraphella]|nr:hypothetical protein [Xylographa opegraphella]